MPLQRVDGKHVTDARHWSRWTQIVDVPADHKDLSASRSIGDVAASIALQREAQARGSLAGLSVNNVEPCTLEGAKDGDRHVEDTPDPMVRTTGPVAEGAEAQVRPPESGVVYSAGHAAPPADIGGRSPIEAASTVPSRPAGKGDEPDDTDRVKVVDKPKAKKG